MSPEAENPGDERRSSAWQQVGREFYRQNQELLSTQQTRPLVGNDEPGVAEAIYEDPKLREYTKYPGTIAEFSNRLGQPCSVEKRQAVSPDLIDALEFSVYSDSDAEGAGDWIDAYLISPSGQILAAEHRLATSDNADYEFSPIPIHLEELLFKIQTEFRPSPESTAQKDD
ncbi:MAG TPA: hypothetical protein VLE72_03085 [Candidatus Saccharimonadales bacterium]|nr:hypothetical protein [Candidatus Saccharimonadales bacterium]